jgi:hypothetical protein
MAEGVHKLQGGSEGRSLISRVASWHTVCYRYAAFRVPKMFGFNFLIPTRPYDFYR